MRRNSAAIPLYKTPRGTAYVGDSLVGMDEHIEWFSERSRTMWRKLRGDGSLVIDLGGAWRKGSPTPVSAPVQAAGRSLMPSRDVVAARAVGTARPTTATGK